MYDSAFKLNPGDLRHAIVWQEKSRSGTQDSFGQMVYDWLDVLRCRVKVETRQGTENQAAMQKWAEAQYVLTQHFSRGLKAGMRIAWFIDGETQYLDVLSIDDPNGMGRFQTVACRNFEDVNVQA